MQSPEGEIIGAEEPTDTSKIPADSLTANSTDKQEGGREGVFAEVDPLKGVSVVVEKNGLTGEAQLRWKDSPGVIVGRNRPKATLLHEGPQASEIEDLINNPERFEEGVKALPVSRMDASEKGTRGIRTVVAGIPGKIVNFSGIGVVRIAGEWNSKTKQRDETFVIEPPRPSEKLSQHITMGTMYVDAEGNVWSKTNHSPFGAYELDDLERKVRNTQEYGRAFGVDVLAAGKYEGEEDIGWFVYGLPEDVLTPPEAQALDIQLPPEQQGVLYGGVVEQMLAEVRGLHDRDIVHAQLHPGNWYVRFGEDGKPKLVIADWSTATKLDDLSSRASFEGHEGVDRLEDTERRLEGLTPQQKAKALDIANALSSATMLDTSQVLDHFSWEQLTGREKGLSVDLSNLWVTKDSIEYQLRMLSSAITGYLQKGINPQDQEKVYSTLFETYKRRLLNMARAKGSRGFYKGNTYEELFEEDHSEYVVRAARDVLLTDVGKILASHEPEAVFQNLLDNGSLLSEEAATIQ
ncbi:hypothetical protein HYS93_03765 [Candidatus Daviesbacteria bacterium]|nr:hypothetical protein [Candidatus Daviesbacteria bacterium]